MARNKYTLTDQIAGLDAIDDANGDYATASAASGYSQSQLRKWNKQRDDIRREQQLHEREQNARRMQQLISRMMERAAQIVDQMDEETIANAPLNQLSSMLGVLVDRYIKLQDLMPALETEQVIRLEYKYPDGTIHSTPPWAEEDSEQPRPLSGGGMRETLRQNGDGEDYLNGSSTERETWLVARPDLPDGESGLARPEDDLDEGGWYHD